MNFKEFYIKNYRKLILIPLIIVILSLIIITVQYFKINDIFDKDVTLKGGITATIYTDKEINNLENLLKSKFKTDFIIRKLTEFGTEKQTGIIIETTDMDETGLETTLENILKIELNQDNYSLEKTSSILAASFYKQMLTAIIFAFLFMALVVFIIFRTFIPSIAVIASAFSDIITTIAVINILGMKVSIAGIAALLLILGYSLDTDLLLTTKVIKRKEGQIFDRVFDSMETGLTMTITTLTALVIAYFISASFVLKEIFLIIIIGLLADIIVTYLFNAPIIINYVKKKENA